MKANGIELSGILATVVEHTTLDIKVSNWSAVGIVACLCAAGVAIYKIRHDAEGVIIDAYAA